MPEAPINIGQKLPDPKSYLQQLTKNNQVMGGTKFSPLADTAKKLLLGYSHKIGKLIAIDYKIDDETGRMHFHIFPRVPDHRRFYPDDQAFANLLQGSVRAILGDSVQVDAEYHEIDGIGPTGAKTDTRVSTYYRDTAGALTSIEFPHLVPMVWFAIGKTPGMLMPRDRAMGMVAESLVETSNHI